MKKTKILDSFFLVGYNNQELRILAKSGRIDENQEDLAVVFRAMRFQDAVEVVENHKSMKGYKKDLNAFIENNDVAEAVKVSAAVYLCNNGGYRNV